MARSWCVASAEPIALQRLLAGSLFGLLIFAGFDPTFTERSTVGRAAWLASTLGVGVAVLIWYRRRPRVAVAARLVIDGAAGLHVVAGPPGTAAGPDQQAGEQAGRAQDTGEAARCAGAWRCGSWQFVRLAPKAGPDTLTLAFDRRRCDPDDWAALQRALVRARRKPVPTES